MFNRIKKFLKSPAVISEIPQWLLGLCSGAVVFLILAIFQPFNINDNIVGPIKFAIIGGFGLITFLIVIICPWLIQLFDKDFYDAKKWTNGYAIINFFVTVGIIILGNFLYLSILESEFRLNSLFSMAWQTLVISIFVYYINLVFENRTLKKNLQTASLINQHIINQTSPTPAPENNISINGTGRNDIITINIESLLYIESDKNYCHVSYLVNGKKEEQTIRATILSIESQLSEITSIVRCHRAFLVNTKNISHVERNSGGYHLEMNGCDNSIPVSRSCSSTVLSCIESM